jgi:glycosyltransferase involved in cell wall biosynthesis/ubiquinone/menaquinone biosynthesis C-methylase UbiE
VLRLNKANSKKFLSEIFSVELCNIRIENHGGNGMLDWTGERYVPWMEEGEIHYEHLHRYRFAKEFAKGKKVLDLACGEGYGSLMLSEEAVEVRGIDIDEATIRHASSKYLKENLKFLKGSITDIPIEGDKIFDVVVCFEALEHIEEHDKLLKEVKRLLKADGMFIVSTPNKYLYTDQPNYQNPFHLKELYFNEFKDLLSKNFKSVFLYGQKVYPSSNIFPLYKESGPTKDFPIEKGDKEFLFVPPDKKLARYFIAAASDSGVDKSLVPGNSYLLDLSETLLHEKDAQISHLEGVVREKEKDAERLRIGLAEKEGDLGSLKETISQRDSKVSELLGALSGKDLKISHLENMVREKEAEAEGLRAGLAEKEGDLGGLKETVSQRDSKVSELLVTLSGKDVEISHLEDVVREKESILNHIYNSYGWKVLLICYRLMEKIFPVDTKRRSFVKTIFKIAEEKIDRKISEIPEMTKTPPLKYFLENNTLKEMENLKRNPTARKYRVIFMVGCLEFESKRYRVFNLMEAFKLTEVESDYFFDTDIPSKIHYILSYDVIVLFRTSLTKNVEWLTEKANALNIPVIFDVDDYIFEPAIIPYVDGIRGWSIKDKKEYGRGVLGYRQTLEHCDFVTAPTSFLTEKASELGKKAYVVRNTLNQEQLEICEKVLESKGSSDLSEGVRIGYFSGTKTHQKDFAGVYAAILKVLSEFSDVKLLVGGYLDLDEFPEFKEFEDKIQRIPFVDWKRLPYEIGSVDINIIPLEVNNPFCDAKSELKYFEAGILKIPSIASPTATFREIITHGENGFLAETIEDWYACLKELIVNENLRKTMGERAYKHTVNMYTPSKLSSNIKEVYRQIILDFREVRTIKRDALSIIFVVPSPVKGSGGHKDIFLIANCLVEFGNRVIIIFPPDGNFDSNKKLEKFITDHFSEPKFEIILGLDIFSCDALLATHYTTAYLAKENIKRTACVFYFVQDYEVYFNPMGDEFIRAERTYKFGFHHITLGDWLKRILVDKYGGTAESIPFWIEKDIYYPRDGQRKKKIAFFARPEMPRRCFNTGLGSLEMFHKRNPDVEIILFGSENMSRLNIPFKYTDMGVLSRESLAKLYSEVSLGMAFATTNPSFVSYEMMACKCPVLDIRMNAQYDFLKYRSEENVILVEPEPIEIADTLENVLSDPHLRERVAENGLKFVNSFPDIRAAAEKFESIIREKLIR